MRIAIDKGPLMSGHKVRGVGAYVRELIKAIKRLSDQDNKLTVDAFDFSTNHKSQITNHYDIVHYPYFHPYFLTLPLKTCLPAGRPTKNVVTIHDLIPLIYPKHYPPGLRGKFKFKLQKYLIKGVNGVITPSETSKKDIVRFLGIPQEKIKVIYEAPRKIFRRITDHRTLNTAKRKYNLPEHFVLYVGDVNYNKNILGLAKACKIAKVRLVIVGKQATDDSVDLTHPENRSFAEFLEKYGDDSRVARLGFVPDKELVAIYNLASVYCQPSFYEGFGLPVLEAMACGTPVVAGRTQALVEVAEDSPRRQGFAGQAALFADPKNPKDLAKKLTEVIKNLKTKEELIKKGFHRVKDFSWEKAAKETIEFYKMVNDQ